MVSNSVICCMNDTLFFSLCRRNIQFQMWKRGRWVGVGAFDLQTATSLCCRHVIYRRSGEQIIAKTMYLDFARRRVIDSFFLYYFSPLEVAPRRNVFGRSMPFAKFRLNRVVCNFHRVAICERLLNFQLDVALQLNFIAAEEVRTGIGTS